MAVGVDEPRADNLTLGIDDAPCHGESEGANVSNAIALDGHISRVARVASAVGHPAAADQDIEHRT
ncbi:MAG TPA: hypothetical protein VGL99_03085 [Chloroflexota bacterium]|jgi:hypothetical protein